MMIKRTKIFCLWVLFVSLAGAQQGEVDINERLLDYLTGYCDEGEAVTFITFIQKNAEAVEPILTGYVKKGVPEELVQKAEKGLEKQFAERQKFLNEDLKTGMNEKSLDIIKNQSKEDFVKSGIEEFRAGFMSTAIFGLSLVDTKEARTLIAGIAKDKKSPHQRAAQNAINKVYQKR